MTRAPAGRAAPPPRRSPARSWLPPVALAAVAAVWGVTFTVVDDTVDALSAVDVVAWRFGLATVVLALLRRAGPALPPQLRGRSVLLGLLLGSGFLLQAWALTYTDALVSGFLTGMLVVVAPVAGWLLFRERPAVGVGPGAALAVLGVLVLGGPGGRLGPGEGLTLAAAAVWGLHLVLMSRWSQAPYALSLARAQTATVAVTALLAGVVRAVVTGTSPLPAVPADAITWAAVGYLAVAATAGALVLLSWSQARVDPTRAAVILTLEPAVSGLTAAATGRTLTARVVVGSVLLLGAMLLVELARRRRPTLSVPPPRVGDVAAPSVRRPSRHPLAYRPAPGSIPDQPGVYRFSDPEGRVIYVGKAKSLRSRLNSYFADLSSLHSRTQSMVLTAARVDWTVVQTEVEALQLEYSWIKEFDPRFNVKYRDDKSYPWMAVTLGEEFPRVMVGRGPKRKGTRYFGPYSHAWAIRETVDLVLRVFPMRSCRPGVFKNHRQLGRPCLLGYIGKCSAPCVGRVSAEEHREIVDDFCTFMAGQSGPMVKRLERDMMRASDELEFERAARIRDDIGALQRATEQNAIVFRDGTDADVVAVAEDPLEVAVQIFHVRGGRVRGERGWVADRFDESETGELVESFLLQLYSESEPSTTDRDAVPREILVPALPPSLESLTELLSERRGSHVEIRVPQRGDKKTLMETVARNATQALIRHKTTRAGDLSTRNRALEEIQEALELPSVPLRMECFDISNLQGTEVVASMVVFEDGLPRKSEYRRFVIRGIDGQNDVAAMHEVITRRFRRLIDDRSAMATAEADGSNEGPLLVDPTTGAPRRFAYAPALVVVDGGPPQVAAAAQALDELGISDVALCGLAKRLEEVWLPDLDEPVILPRTSEGLYLLQRLRDEAHRFAITHHRSRRSKSMVESLLDQVPGLGEVRRKALMTHFGSLKKLRQASVEEIAAVPGFGPKLAQSILDALAAAPQREAVNTATGEILTGAEPG